MRSQLPQAQVGRVVGAQKMAANEVPSRPVPVPTTGFMASLTRLVERVGPFRGVSISRATEIMMGFVHGPEQVGQTLGHGTDFLEKYPHLERVPYPIDVLEWAAETNAVVLTLDACSMRHAERTSRGVITLPEEGMYDDTGASLANKWPNRPDWRLVMRPREGPQERSILRGQPPKLKYQMCVPRARLALAMLYFDQLYWGEYMSTNLGPRSTADSIVREDGVRRIMVGGNGNVNGRIAVRISQGTADAPPMVAWRPFTMKR